MMIEFLNSSKNKFSDHAFIGVIFCLAIVIGLPFLFFFLLEEITFFRYALVGVGSVAVKYGGFALPFSLGINYKVSAISGALASSIFHFTANRCFTFKSKEQLLPQMLRYSVMALLNITVLMITITTLVSKFGLSPYISMGISILFCMMVNFTLSRLWIFKVAKCLEN